MINNRLLITVFLSFIFIFSINLMAVAVDYQESPMLTEQVDKGELPPIEDRIPEDPLIVDQGVLIADEDLEWKSGKYGGTLQSAHTTPDWSPDVFIMTNEPLLMAPGISTDGIRGNILKDYSANEDNSVFTFNMRKGLKWSDGVPVTTEDIRFTYEDVLLNEEITPIFPAKYRTGGSPEGEPMELEIIDEYTFKLKFEEPYGAFLRDITISGWVGYTELLKPKHYLKKFHIDYTPMEELKPYLEEEELGEEDWFDLFTIKDVENWDLTRRDAIGFPSLYPWLRVESSEGLLRFKRNPYYFKVDNEGKQLPYIDEIESFEVNDVEMLRMKIITGEMDYERSWSRITGVPLYKEHEEKGGYNLKLLDFHVDPICLFLNLTYDDPAWREVVRNVKFRKALSLSFDREEINESLFFGFGSLPELIPSQYDVKQANQLLDDIGLDQKDKEGYRIGPDGETFEIFIEQGGHREDIIAASELITEQLKENLSIKAETKQISDILWEQRTEANEIKATVFWLPQPQWEAGTRTDYLPTNNWAPLWDRWYNTGGETGEEPPEDIKRLYQLDEQRRKVIPGSQEDKEIVKQIYDLHYDNVYNITMIEKVPYPMIASKKLGNIPTSGMSIGANYSAEQFFFEEE